MATLHSPAMPESALDPGICGRKDLRFDFLPRRVPDHPFEFERGRAEVEQQADLDPGGLEVVQQLGFFMAG
jgi:hypothetical protein